jgi:hypothetical protein
MNSKKSVKTLYGDQVAHFNVIKHCYRLQMSISENGCVLFRGEQIRFFVFFGGANKQLHQFCLRYCQKILS